jgi:dCTP deaminase
MILSDKDIKANISAGKILIETPRTDYVEQIHASSMDMRLGRFFKVYEHGKVAVLDPRKMSEVQALMRMIEIQGDEAFVVQPGQFVLGVTLEKLTLPHDIVGRVEGRSSLGRLGIVVHSTAGFIDAGFYGTITLEITNLNQIPIALYPEMRVCQIAFELMSSPAQVPYGEKISSKYQGQEFPGESKVGSDSEFQ